jgi:kynurenine formamidase
MQDFSMPEPTPSQVLAALGLVTDGSVFDLGTELGPATLSGPEETFAPFRLSPYRIPKAVTSDDEPPPFDFSMEVVSGSLHVGTHIDGLAHIHSHGRMHGGVGSRDSWSDDGWMANGAEHLPPFVQRGILLDVARLRGVDVIEGSSEITAAELDDCATRAGVAVRPGTAVLVRTGKIRQFHSRDHRFHDSQPGVGPDGAEHLAELGMTLLGSDTSGTEPHPMPNLERTTHRSMLVERGIPLLEILDLEELAERQMVEFCLIALPLRIRGATGSWVRPIALA